jgi:hypothetical protein
MVALWTLLGSTENLILGQRLKCQPVPRVWCSHGGRQRIQGTEPNHPSTFKAFTRKCLLCPLTLCGLKVIIRPSSRSKAIRKRDLPKGI